MEINKKIFKKYDIRGIYPSEINGETVYKIATKLANNLFRKGIVITARDTRIGSPNNPKEYNGLKVVTKGAEMVGGENIQTMLKIK